MSKIYIANDGERLDTIVYKHYGTLENFAEILAFNSHLNAILKVGDKVFLPEIKTKTAKKENTLW
ncbi:tail protein X [Campylobacter hyointestinalis]|uniref:Phage tail protein n=1 Tax=Campylobacter hyointestinalis subsp. hyointestinalis TaxID=91352 RepID=A0A855NBD6_CAMHY|nr:tail protein X [Campylobacter hyointestinalis]PPB51490.1 phage tail protein [Campylobacter hyointestinalis subsp. hyointestinalis]PPB58626.1 phage tail protein [Campylobacter hyointestinalis subsp. hyointestinalis]PPB60462.1 phage tail protein [Campylobacter hyointestinalis subsp. hyointestinalis]PPB64168.1 phage tail protein [Campylobacter hyointestinalis subsp. hyointestinalis]PPB64848.1 phage tail protein [Campylobacter hyointestinalis subsp. hyointestinalis]